jgi:hypothetical protein
MSDLTSERSVLRGIGRGVGDRRSRTASSFALEVEGLFGPCPAAIGSRVAIELLPGGVALPRKRAQVLRTRRNVRIGR